MQIESQVMVDRTGAVRWEDNGALVDGPTLIAMGFTRAAVDASERARQTEEQARLARMAEDAAALAAWQLRGGPAFGLRIGGAL